MPSQPCPHPQRRQTPQLDNIRSQFTAILIVGCVVGGLVMPSSGRRGSRGTGKRDARVRSFPSFLLRSRSLVRPQQASPFPHIGALAHLTNTRFSLVLLGHGFKHPHLQHGTWGLAILEHLWQQSPWLPRHISNLGSILAQLTDASQHPFSSRISPSNSSTPTPIKYCWTSWQSHRHAPYRQRHC